MNPAREYRASRLDSRHHHSRHGSDTDNFAYLGDSVRGQTSTVGFLGAEYAFGLSPEWLGKIAAGTCVVAFILWGLGAMY